MLANVQDILVKLADMLVNGRTGSLMYKNILVKLADIVVHGRTSLYMYGTWSIMYRTWS